MLFWVVKPCRFVGKYKRFGETQYLYLHSYKHFSPEDRDSMSHHWYLPMILHSVTTQKNNIVILTTAKPQNLTEIQFSATLLAKVLLLGATGKH